jgi:hypothetical protein
VDRRFGASALRWLVRGGTDTALGVIATIALIIWASDEVVRGVNPWRRALGAGALGIAAFTWVLAR